MALYTIDPYTNIEQYNESLQALRNNKVQFKQMISLRAPYYWYFDLPYAPMLVNYDEADKKILRYVVSKVIPIRPADEYELLRREGDQKNIKKYIENAPLEEARLSDYTVFFNAPSAEILKSISKNLPGTKIWYFGKHVAGKFRIALCSNRMINNYLTPNSVLIEKDTKTKKSKVTNVSNFSKDVGGSDGVQGNQGNDYSKPGFLEADLNYRVFKQKDSLRKYSETPYFLNGVYYPVKFQGTLDNPDMLARFTF